MEKTIESAHTGQDTTALAGGPCSTSAQLGCAISKPDNNADQIEKKFHTLTALWRQETQFSSSVTDIVMHMAYQHIIGMGPVVVPLILRELEKRPDHWFWALHAITEADPITPAQRGRVKEMAEAWLCWGRERGYL